MKENAHHMDHQIHKERENGIIRRNERRSKKTRRKKSRKGRHGLHNCIRAAKRVSGQVIALSMIYLALAAGSELNTQRGIIMEAYQAKIGLVGIAVGAITKGAAGAAEERLKKRIKK